MNKKRAVGDILKDLLERSNRLQIFLTNELQAVQKDAAELLAILVKEQASRGT